MKKTKRKTKRKQTLGSVVSSCRRTTWRRKWKKTMNTGAFMMTRKKTKPQSHANDAPVVVAVLRHVDHHHRHQGAKAEGPLLRVVGTKRMITKRRRTITTADHHHVGTVVVVGPAGNVDHLRHAGTMTAPGVGWCRTPTNGPERLHVASLPSVTTCRMHRLSVTLL